MNSQIPHVNVSVLPSSDRNRMIIQHGALYCKYPVLMPLHRRPQLIQCHHVPEAHGVVASAGYYNGTSVQRCARHRAYMTEIWIKSLVCILTYGNRPDNT